MTLDVSNRNNKDKRLCALYNEVNIPYTVKMIANPYKNRHRTIPRHKAVQLFILFSH